MGIDPSPAMEDTRAEACAACGQCALVAPEGLGPVPYEIHVTVALAQVSAFRDTCLEIGVKPLLLALQLASGGVASDAMTSSIHMGTDCSAIAEATRIAGLLGASGFEVVRTKIETVPWHPEAPSRSNGLSPRPGKYFESHIAVICPPGGRKRLEEITAGLNLHLSRNTLKDNGDGSGTIMATARSYSANHEDFREEAQRCRDEIEGHGFVVDKLIVEYALHDSRISHDAAWTGSGQ